MNISITEDINGQKYVRVEQEQKGLPLSQRFKDWQFIQKPKTGHWIDVDGIWFKCSECDAHRKMTPAYKEYYCPHCGARMAESEET